VAIHPICRARSMRLSRASDPPEYLGLCNRDCQQLTGYYSMKNGIFEEGTLPGPCHISGTTPSFEPLSQLGGPTPLPPSAHALADGRRAIPSGSLPEIKPTDISRRHSKDRSGQSRYYGSSNSFAILQLLAALLLKDIPFTPFNEDNSFFPSRILLLPKPRIRA